MLEGQCRYYIRLEETLLKYVHLPLGGGYNNEYMLYSRILCVGHLVLKAARMDMLSMSQFFGHQ